MHLREPITIFSALFSSFVIIQTGPNSSTNKAIKIAENDVLLIPTMPCFFAGKNLTRVQRTLQNFKIFSKCTPFSPGTYRCHIKTNNITQVKSFVIFWQRYYLDCHFSRTSVDNVSSSRNWHGWLRRLSTCFALEGVFTGRHNNTSTFWHL